MKYSRRCVHKGASDAKVCEDSSSLTKDAIISYQTKQRIFLGDHRPARKTGTPYRLGFKSGRGGDEDVQGVGFDSPGVRQAY